MKKIFFLFLLAGTLFSSRSIAASGFSSLEPIKNAVDGNVSSIIPILNSINYAQLNQLIRSGNEQALLNFYTPIANQIAAYVMQNYGEDILPDIINAPDAGIVLALFYYGKETGIVIHKTDPGQDVDPMGCFTGALGALFGIKDLRSIYADFSSGNVGPKTVIKAIKTIGRRVATVIAIALAVYGLGDCLNWW